MVANEVLQQILSWANQVLPDESSQASYSMGEFQRPQSALIVSSKFIGDNVLLLPFIQSLRANMGTHASLDLISSPAMAPFFETLPDINRIYIERTPPLRTPSQFLRSQQYDSIFLCRYTPVWALAAVKANIPQRVGFDLTRLGIHGLQCWGKSLTHVVPSTPYDHGLSQDEVYLSILHALGLQVFSMPQAYPVPNPDFYKAFTLLQPSQRRPKILIHATSGSPGKSWPLPNWIELLQQLQQAYQPGFIATGQRKDAVLYEEFPSALSILNLCGQTNLRETIAILKQVDLVITLDTAIAHLAALAGTPRLVVIYGPTNHQQWKPRIRPGTHLEQVFLDLPCRPCLARTCGTKACLLQLGVEPVYQAIERSFQRHPLVLF